MDVWGQYHARKAADRRRAQEREPMPYWWLGQRDPVARFTKWLVCWTALLFVGTIGSAIVLWITDHTLRETLEANNRAWIAIVNANLEAAIEVGQPVRSNLLYRNSGQSPALKVVYRMRVSRSTFLPNKSLPLPQTNICDEVEFPGIITVFPSDKPSQTYFPQSRRPAIDRAIIDGKESLIWDGCFKYETYKKPRKTRFCYWLRQDGDSWYWQDCGVEAD